MARIYKDISHFRAPYKSMYVAGFGADTPLYPGTERGPSGLVQYQVDQIIPIMERLKNYLFVFQGGEYESGMLQPLTPDQINQAAAGGESALKQLYSLTAQAKVEQWWNEGKIVFVGIQIQTQDGSPISMAAVSKGDSAKLSKLAAEPTQYAAPVLPDIRTPAQVAASKAANKAGIGAFGIVAIAVAVGGIGYFIYQGAKKHRRY